jgi:YgiT-type zinc finger domain-containing protein
MSKSKKETVTPEVTGNEPENTPETQEETSKKETVTPEVAGNEPEPGKTTLSPCPQCKSTKVKGVGVPTQSDYRNVETIIKQTAKCEECGAVYLSRVSRPKPAKGLCSKN